MEECKSTEVLFKTNTLIKGQVNITSNEYKIFNKILYKAQKEINNEIQIMAVLSVDELRELVKIKNESTPKALLETLERFMRVVIRFEKEKAFVSTSLINKVEVDKETGAFKCYLDKDLYNVLMGYKEIGYSPIDLKLIRNVNGYYTQRLYELFRVWSGTKSDVTYSIEELKQILMINKGTSYDLYSNFRIKVIDAAIKEINAKLNMNVGYCEKKVGRKITAITFKIKDYEPRKYDFNKDKIIEPKEINYKSEIAIGIDGEIDSIDYMNFIDCKLNKSIHNIFLDDFYDYKEYLKSVATASEKVRSTLGAKTINRRNYKYFKTALENLMPDYQYVE